jgi:hypothetical protein
MSDTLTDRFTEVVYLLGCYVIGDGTLRDEMHAYVAGETAERAVGVLGDIEELLSDGTVRDEQLDAFVRAHASRWNGSGRATLERVGEALMRVLETKAGFRPADADTSPPPDVRDRLAAWLREMDLIPPEDFTGWTVADAGEDRWVLTPPGMAGVILVVTPSTIRAIRPAFESVPDALRELGIS